MQEIGMDETRCDETVPLVVMVDDMGVEDHFSTQFLRIKAHQGKDAGDYDDVKGHGNQDENDPGNSD
jgi:hypothetical protein